MTLTQLIIITLFVLAGIIVFLSPIFRGIQGSCKNIANKTEYQELLEMKEAAETEYERDEKENPFNGLLNAIVDYNQELYYNNQEQLTAELPKAKEGTGFDTCLFGLEINTFGYVAISRKRTTKIRKKEKESKELNYPIYLKVKNSNLINGFTPLPQTSLPIGGENTFSILYGYPKSGIGKDKKFDIKVGDVITITNLWDTLEYRITDLCYLTKDDVDYMKIEDGKDEVALLISEPKSKYRYCAYASRIVSEGEETKS